MNDFIGTLSLATVSAPSGLSVPGILGTAIPPYAFFGLGILLLIATAGAFMLQVRRAKIADSSCPRCGTRIGDASAGETLRCHVCSHQFVCSGYRTRRSSPGPLVYTGVAVSSTLLLVGAIVLIEQYSATPIDYSEYSLSDYPTEIHDLRLRAEQGDSEAQYELGRFHDRGTPDFPPNPGEAFLWYQEAAEAGDSTAQLAVGTLYDMGHGVVRNPGKAEHWLTRAAEVNVVEAQKILGVLYLGKGSLPYRPEESIRWMTRAAENGDGEAQFHLSVAYHKGEGVERDLAKSEQWLEKAVASGYEPAKSIVRRRDAQFEDQIDAMWRRAAETLPGGSPFSPPSPSTYVPPQFEEARRRAEEAMRVQQQQGYR